MGPKEDKPLDFGETVLDILDLMDAFAKRHWMHSAGETVAEFAKRLRRAYMFEKYASGKDV